MLRVPSKQLRIDLKLAHHSFEDCLEQPRNSGLFALLHEPLFSFQCARRMASWARFARLFSPQARVYFTEPMRHVSRLLTKNSQNFFEALTEHPVLYWTTSAVCVTCVVWENPSSGRFKSLAASSFDSSSRGLTYKRILTLKVPICQKKTFRGFFALVGAPFRVRRREIIRRWKRRVKAFGKKF